MLDTNKKNIDLNTLGTYDHEIKQYIKDQGLGLTEDDVKKLINVQISEDSTYEPLETEV